MHCMYGAVSVAWFVGMVGMVWYCMFYCLSGTYGMLCYVILVVGMVWHWVWYGIVLYVLRYILHCIPFCVAFVVCVRYGMVHTVFCFVRYGVFCTI